MTRRIWFTQQKPFHYIPLRLGLGYINDFKKRGAQNYIHYTKYCPKTYTTRTRPLSGEYCVVEGSRYKAVAVEPRIEFRVNEVYRLDLRSEKILSDDWVDGLWRSPETIRSVPDDRMYTFPELDLGLVGTTFAHLRETLLRLNKSATIDTSFYVNVLEPR